jgi:hypothetical protein
MFHDATFASRIGPLSTKRAGWANAWIDFNNDGWKDLFSANSHVNDLVEKFEPGSAYRQANSVFVNQMGKTFVDSEDPALAAAIAAHRGAAFADFDGDGRIDIVVTVLGGTAELWRNVTEGANDWIAVRVPPQLVGATVRITAAGREQWNIYSPAVGYASASDIPVHFGLGKLPSGATVRIEIQPAGGSKHMLENVKPNQIVRWKLPDN